MNGKKQTVWICRGLPASGKTTWANLLVSEYKAKIARFNNDDIRDRLTAGAISEGTFKWTPKFEKDVQKVFNFDMTTHLDQGYDVVLDNTYLNPKTLKALQTFLTQNYPNVIQVIKDFRHVLVNECLKRDKERGKAGERSVGAPVILEMWAKYVLPTIPPYHSLLPYTGLAIIVDLDGTLAVLNGREPYDASNCDVTDTPNRAVLDLVKNYLALYYKVFFVSGRMDKDREPTLRFLKNSCGLGMNNPLVELLMRKTDDTRHDWIIKKEIFDANIRDKYEVLFCVDDRPMVIRMWKELGLTVLDVGAGVEF